jgi:hypothetical protein
MTTVDSEYPDKRFHKKTTRCTNILSPHYKIHDLDIEDDLKGSKPKPLKHFISDNFVLKTNDIPGATPGWIEEVKQVRQVRDLTSTQDIEGAQADTFKRVLVTKRITDPIVPFYQSLDGGGQLLVPPHEPLLPSEFHRTLNLTVGSELGEITSRESSSSQSTLVLDKVNNLHQTEEITDDNSFDNLPDLELTSSDSYNKSREKVSSQRIDKNHSTIFDHYHEIVPDDRKLKISQFNIYDKKYHRDISSTGVNENTEVKLAAFLSSQRSESRPTYPSNMRITDTLKVMEMVAMEREKQKIVPSVHQRQTHRKLKEEVDAVRNLKF